MAVCPQTIRSTNPVCPTHYIGDLRPWKLKNIDEPFWEHTSGLCSLTRTASSVDDSLSDPFGRIDRHGLKDAKCSMVAWIVLASITLVTV